MTLDEFKNRMQSIIDEGDTESFHIRADNLMCELLSELGYDEGVELFKNTPKWYA